jgi:hypothetical protein
MTAEATRPKDIADFFRLGLLGGILPVHEPVVWADSLIAASDSPELAALELSVSEAQGRLAAIDALKAFAGPSDDTLPTHLLLARCHQLVCSAQSDEFTVLSALRGLPLPDDIYSRIDSLDDAKHLAEHEHYGTLDDVRADVREFLSRFAV